MIGGSWFVVGEEGGVMESREIVRRAIEFERPERLPFWQHWNHKMPGFPDDVHNIWEMDRAEAGWFFDRPGVDDWGCGWSTTELRNIGQVTAHPLADWSNLEGYRPPNPRNPFYYERLGPLIGAAGGRYVVLTAHNLLFSRLHKLRGFADFGFHSQALKFLYYLAFTMLFWLAYTVYTIPYYAVVAEITPDYDERTDIRGLSALINAAGIFAGNALPAVLPAVILGLGLSAKTGWLGTVVFMSLLSILFAVIAVFSLRHVTLQKAEAEAGGQRSVREIFGSFLEVLKIKPFKWFVLFVFAFLISSSMLQTNFVYLIKLVFQLKTETEAKDKMVVIIVVLVGVIALLTPVVTKIAEIKDRRFAAILFFSISLAGLAAGRFMRLGAQAAVTYVAFFMAVGAACFWTVFYSMAYDLVEVDEFISGRRREGVITALPQFFQKFGSAVGMLLVSLVLNISGYQADEVPPEFIINASTIIPAAFLGVSIFGAFMFPVTKERFHLLQEVLAKKNAGESFDTAGLEKLI